MAVTKQAYTLSATWTASGLADLLRSAFIDAGLMTDWYDSFLSGSVENRILEVVNDGTKTYGTVYYWFMFTTTSPVFSVHIALSWDAVSHIPAGTQYQDYYSTTTNSTTNHCSIYSGLVTTTSLTLTRYTSAINTSCTWFILRQSSIVSFLIPFGAFTTTSFVDQNVTAFNGLTVCKLGATSYGASLEFRHSGAHTRRTYLGATAARGTTFNSYYNLTVDLSKYSAIGNVSNFSTANLNNNDNEIRLPTALTNTHSGLASDYTPVFTSIQYSPYAPPLPADFAMSAYYASTAVSYQDTFIVNSGVEEYEVLYVNNGSNGSILFLARTV